MRKGIPRQDPSKRLTLRSQTEILPCSGNGDMARGKRDGGGESDGLRSEGPSRRGYYQSRYGIGRGVDVERGGQTDGLGGEIHR